ncbi:hypothetical protein Tco_0881538 [Tanacetum coccineum]
MASLDHRLNPLFSIKECMTCGALYTADFCCSKGGLEDKISLVPKPPQNCYNLWKNPVMVYLSILVLLCLEQCNQTINELQQTLPSVHPTCNYEDENSFTYDSRPNSFNDSPSVLTHPPQLQFETYLCELCGNNAHDCSPQFPLFPVNYPPQETSREIMQAQKDLMEAIQAFLKEYDHIPPNEKCMALMLAEERFLKIKQTMEEKQNQPGVMQQLLLKLMDDLQKYINCPSWNRPLFYFNDDDDEYTVIWRRPKAITPDEPSEEPEDPLIIGEKELSTILEKDKSSVEDLVPIPSGSKDVSDDICDNSNVESLLSQDILITSPKIDFLSEEFTGEFTSIPPKMDEDEFDEEEVDCYDHDFLSDDDFYENIEYVEASPLNLEYDNLEEENEDEEEKEFNLEDIFQIQYVILREKLLNVHRLITNIKSLKNNPTPDFVFKSPSLFPIPVVDSDSFFDEEFLILLFIIQITPLLDSRLSAIYTEETREVERSTQLLMLITLFPSMIRFFLRLNLIREVFLTSVVISDNSNDPLLEFPEFESFHFDLDPSFPRPPPEPLDVEISLIDEPDA